MCSETKAPPLKRYIRVTACRSPLTSHRRDRENCTVFVADLPVGVTENELQDLFKDVSGS
jgi:squamous cell carcinoma antigen recognized by T-cells 3